MAHRDEVVTDDAKTHPDFHTIMSFVAAAVQSVACPETSWEQQATRRKSDVRTEQRAGAQ
jgi:hypothetical protein